jgi:hypothetical protein
MLLFVSDKVMVVKDTEKWETYKVAPTGKPSRTFRGETAWCDAERYATDYDFNALGCTSK